MDIRTIALIGAGAVGAYFVEGLSHRPDLALKVIAEGERAERLRRDGLTVNGRTYPLSVCTAAEAGPMDLILVAVKYGALRDTLPSIRAMTGPGTIILSLLNGVDSEEIIGEAVGMEHMVYSLMRISAERVGSSITYDPAATGGLFFGEKGTDTPSERTDAIEAALQGTGLHLHRMEDIIADQWTKFAVNCAGNLPQAILNVGTGAYNDSEHVNELSRLLWEEVRTVAAAKGITISAYPFTDRKRPFPPRTRWSTLQDLDAHRHTEIETFSGAMMAMGRDLGIPVPYSTFAYHTVKALEQKNDGLFDY